MRLLQFSLLLLTTITIMWLRGILNPLPGSWGILSKNLPVLEPVPMDILGTDLYERIPCADAPRSF